MPSIFKSARFFASASLSLFLAVPLQAAALKSAEITAIVNDVKVVNSSQGVRPAKLQETISGQSSVQTGLKSRTELLFSDKTMARLGANSMFSFTNGTRDIDLKQGTMLLQVPKGAGGAKITTAAVTAAITGTTIMIEYFPGGFTKVIVLEGTLRLFVNNRVGESILLEPGKMVILNPNATQLPEPVDVDIKRLVKTSKLIKGIDGTDMDLKIVQNEIDKQEKEKKKGDLIGTNLVITGSGTEVILASDDLLNTLQNAAEEQQQLLGDNGNGNPGPTPPGPTPPPGPTKYNPVTTITSPDPYIINSTTTIVTDPTITTNGITDQGTLYNSTVQPGNTSDFLFGGTSAFDTSSSFNTSFLGQDYSVFRFTELEINESPVIDTNGGPKNLFLVSENNITLSSGFVGSFGPSLEGPVNPIDFTGLDFLGLATMDGYISISSALTGPVQLDLYARGSSEGEGEGDKGKIFIDAPITLGSGSTLGVFAQSGIYSSGTLTATTINMRSGADVDLGYSFLTAASIDVNAAGVVTMQGYNIDTGGLTTLTVNGNTINYSGSGDFSGATANFTAGTGGFTGTSVSLFQASSLLSSGDITIGNTFTNPAVVNISGIIAASGNIDVTGELAAGSIGALNNVTAHKLTSSTNINSTLGNILTTNGDMSATNNITAAGTINSSGSIVAGDLLQGAGITAGGGISGGTIQSNSGDIDASGGNLLSTAGSITSAGKINAGGGINSAADLTAASDITAGDFPSSDPGIIAAGSITSTTGNVLNNGTGNIIAGYIPPTEEVLTFSAFSLPPPSQNITVAGDLGTLYANTYTQASGTITAGRLVGANDPGAASGSTAFYANQIITNDVVVRNGDNPVVLDAPTVTINGQTSSLDASTFTSTVKYLTLKGGASPITLALSNDFGNISDHLASLTTNALVAISGSNSLYVEQAVLGNNLTLTGANGNLYTDNMSVTGNISVNQIKRFGASQIISATGTIEASGTYGLDFQGFNGTNGGKLDLSAPSLAFGSGPGAVNGATFVGGDNSAGNGGLGGELTATSLNGELNHNNGSSLFAHGGASTGGGLGGNGGVITLKAPFGALNVAGLLNANGGNSSAGKGGSAGTFNLQGQNVNILSTASLDGVGGDATAGSAEGGDGGTLAVNSGAGGSIDIQGTINLTTGVNSGVTYGGNGGSATITGNGPVTISGTIKTSEDSAIGKLSKNGGKISVTSAETDTTKQGITIANSGQLLALLNSASVGKGGKIEFVSSGGSINVAGTVDAGKKGAAGVSGTDGVLHMANNAANGKINILNTATLRGDIIKAEVMGTNGVLTINGGGSGGIMADSQIKLFANQSTGSVVFTGGVINLTSPQILVSANTVTVTGDARVNNAGATTVGANNHNYINGVGPSGLGGFQNPVTQTTPSAP